MNEVLTAVAALVLVSLAWSYVNLHMPGGSWLKTPTYVLIVVLMSVATVLALYEVTRV